MFLYFSKTSFAGAVLEWAALLDYQQLQGLSDIREAAESWFLQTVLLEAKWPFTMVQLRQRLPFSALCFRKVSIGFFLQENYKLQEIKFVLSERFIVALHCINLKTWDQSCLMNVTFWRSIRLALWLIELKILVVSLFLRGLIAIAMEDTCSGSG